MAIRNIRREATNPLAAPGTPNSAPIYVDSDDNILKMIPAGSGTTEVQVIDASSTQTLTNKTLTSPTLTTPGLTSTTGNLSVVGTITSADATTPILATATGKTNTGYLSLTGKTSGSLKVLPADAMGQIVTIAPAAQTSGASTLTIPDQAGANSNFVFDSLAQTLSQKVMGANNTHSTDYKVLAANATFTSNTTAATLTGFSWTVVAGTYVFEVNLPATMTTGGGLTVNFKLTTAVLTSIQYQSYAATATDNATAVSTNGTTTTDATKVFDSATAAYTHVNIKGSMVVGTGGTFAWQACQNTSHTDTTTVAIGSYATLVRAL